jgi:FAD/FMN-containing dehydrogenase
MADSSRNNLVWFTDEKNRSKVDEYNSKALDAVRDPSQETWADFPNSTRTGPIQLRYRGKERLDRLKSLKKEWDPTGVFTNQLLE